MSEVAVLGYELLLNEFYVAKRKMPTGKVYHKRFYTIKDLDDFVARLGDDLKNWSFSREAV